MVTFLKTGIAQIKLKINTAILHKIRPIKSFEFNGADIKKDIYEKYNFSGELVDIFVNNKDRIIHKWHHYIPIYDRYFQSYRGKNIRFLELGVSKGGSLSMWRKYFGEDAIIFGIDIEDNCKVFNGIDGEVRIGSQDDKKFLLDVLGEMGGVDVVLDDGSHKMKHIKKSLSILFPQLSEGGIYMIEDLHTSYWKRYGGGFRSNLNFFNVVRDLIDDLHHWYHKKPLKIKDVSKNCSAIHIHDSIVVLEKNKVFAPTHSRVS